MRPIHLGLLSITSAFVVFTSSPVFAQTASLPLDAEGEAVLAKCETGDLFRLTHDCSCYAQQFQQQKEVGGGPANATDFFLEINTSDCIDLDGVRKLGLENCMSMYSDKPEACECAADKARQHAIDTGEPIATTQTTSNLWLECGVFN